MATNLQTIDMSLPIGSVDAYIRQAQAIPMLTLAEEQELGQRWYQQQDLEAARRLVMAHLRFVVKVARNYMGYGLSQADLIQEGNLGLMKAVKRFDPNLGVRLVTFAVHWIKAEIHDFIIKNWRIVKVATTKAQRKLFYNLRKSKKRLGWLGQQEVAEVAADLGVKPEEVLQMEARMSAYDVSFDAPSQDDDDGQAHSAPAAYLEHKNSDPALLLEGADWQNQQFDAMRQALSQLDERSQAILRARWLNEDKATLHDLAAEYQVSAERIRQLEAKALKQLKQALQGE